MIPTRVAAGVESPERRTLAIVKALTYAMFAMFAMTTDSVGSLGDIIYGFWMASGLAGLLFAGMAVNWLLNPTRAVLEQFDRTEYGQCR